MPVPLRRETLAEQVADGLIAYIEQNAPQPGTLLPSETALAQEFGVSRTVVREALKALAAKDIVAIENGRGAVVRPLSGEPLRDFFHRALRGRYASVVELLEVDKGVEAQGAALAAQRRTEAQVSELGRIVTAMRVRGHDSNLLRLDTRFHLLIAAATHNPLLYHLVASMREPITAAMEAVSRQGNDEQQAQVVTTHERIAAAIAEGDPAAAAGAMADHCDVAIAFVTEFNTDEHPEQGLAPEGSRR